MMFKLARIVTQMKTFFHNVIRKFTQMKCNHPNATTWKDGDSNLRMFHCPDCDKMGNFNRRG